MRKRDQVTEFFTDLKEQYFPTNRSMRVYAAEQPGIVQQEMVRYASGEGFHVPENSSLEEINEYTSLMLQSPTPTPRKKRKP